MLLLRRVLHSSHRGRSAAFTTSVLRSTAAPPPPPPSSAPPPSTRVLTTVQEMRQFRRENAGKLIGLVPTMGCLHQGHMHLVHLAMKQCDAVVVSIFVNPAQFAPHEDLAKYPRTWEQDLSLLQRDGVHVLFHPTVEEVYPAGISVDVAQQRGTFVNVRGMSHQLEGKIRPHHFRGVATVVAKLFNMVQPDKAFFGQKGVYEQVHSYCFITCHIDAQQCAVVRSMVRDLCFPVEVVVGETVREPDGLAMSSRNRYLSAEERLKAVTLYRALSHAKALFVEKGVVEGARLKEVAAAIIGQEKAVQLEYVSLASPFTLEEVEQVSAAEGGAILSGAIRVGKTRIIDNLLLECRL